LFSIVALVSKTPSKRRTSLKWSSKRTIDGRANKHARQQRPPRSPLSRRVDVAATRDKRTDEQTRREFAASVRPSVSYIDGVWHLKTLTFHKVV